MKVLGVDIGGTKIRMGIIDINGQVYVDKIIPTKLPFYPYLEQEILLFLSKNTDVRAIGIGTRGMVDAENGVITFETDTLPGWQGTQVKKLLEKATGLQVQVNNDANCAALAEARFGSAIGYTRTVCLTIGTGLGGGFVFENLIMNGKNGGAGEVGHMILYPRGHKCSCGRFGCSEQYISGTALRRFIEEKNIKDEFHNLITPNDLFQLAQEGHEEALLIIRKFTNDLALVISSLQSILDMDCVVIGGGVSESAEIWLPFLMEALNPLLLNPLEVRKAKFGNEAGMLGAALLVLEDSKECTSDLVK